MFICLKNFTLNGKVYNKDTVYEGVEIEKLVNGGYISNADISEPIKTIKVAQEPKKKKKK